MNWLFVILFMIVIISGALGYCRGFIQTVFSLVAVILAIILTAAISPVLTNAILKNDSIYGGIYNAVEEKLALEEKISESEGGYEISVLEIEEVIDDLTLPQAFKDEIVHGIKNSQEYKADAEYAAGYVYNYITTMIISAVVYVITFICVSIIVVLLAKAVNIIGYLPVVREFNKISGLVAGLILGVCIVYIFLIFVMVFSNTAFGMSSMRCVEGNIILEWLYENNPIWNWIMRKNGL